MLAKTILAVSIALAPAISLAQSTKPLYVGAAATLSTYDPFRSYKSNLFGPALTVGYQLSPRWAIQTGANWNRRTTDTYTGYPASSGSLDRITYDYSYTRLAIPLLARFTFTDPASPLRIDALFGPSWLHATNKSTVTYFYNGTAGSDTNTSRSSANDVSVGLGPSLRYAIGAHLELAASSLLQAEFGDSFNTVDLFVKRRFSDRLFFTTQLGVQYSFGQ